MTIPAWQVIAWDPVVATVDEFDETVTKLRHLATAVHGDDAEDSLRHGQVLWGTEVNGRMVGLAWDWSEVRKDIVAMADPMRVLSNLTLVTRDGAPMPHHERVLYLNNAIHDLGWQHGLYRAAMQGARAR
jgi:hypothetical protein